MSLRIGVDVGGTNTDAVLMDGDQVLAACKKPTTADVTSGIVAAIQTILREAGADKSAITAVMIGTTHFTNAFVEGKSLLKVAMIRLGLPVGRDIPPMFDWPAALKEAICGEIYMIGGGNEYDGREIAPLDEDALRTAIADIRAKGLRAIAVSAVFSPVSDAHEQRAADIIRAEFPEATLTLSSQIGRVGLLERENAAAMNASLAELSVHVVGAFRKALSSLEIDAPFYISQNDGTLMTADHVERYPVLTFASGPTNSMRGAAYLSGAKNALVADIGGTTTDIGMLVNGFPRESSVTVDIGGVRTNFRMPDVLALGLGGGSIVRQAENGVTVGPDSVGFRLTEDAMVFGGATLTASDIAVAAGQTDFGNREKVSHLSRDLIDQALDAMHAKIEEGADRMKTSSEPVPLILVGGGAVLVSRHIRGTSEVITPDNAAVANAIGAAIAQVGGEVDKVVSYDATGRDAALASAREEAIARCVEAGAIADTVAIMDVEEIPLAYVPGGAVRVRIRAVGDLNLDHHTRPQTKEAAR